MSETDEAKKQKIETSWKRVEEIEEKMMKNEQKLNLLDELEASSK